MRLPAVVSRFLAGWRQKAMSAVPYGGGWFNVIREPFAGAFQSVVEADAPRDILSFSGVFAPLTLMAGDIAKLELRLVQEDEDGVCTDVTISSPYWAVVKKPNRYQNRIKFIEQWVVSKLLHGNTYVLKQRDARGIVRALYVLDARRVTPLVTDDGDIYYRLSADHLAGLKDAVTIPAAEIIHDMMVSLWHPLVGVSPIYACALSATMGRRIQANSTSFFGNMSRPGGILTAPAKIADEDAAEYKRRWQEEYSGRNAGRIAVLGGGLTYVPLTPIAAEQAQLIEQLQWTARDIAACFHMPLFKVGGPVPVGSTIDALNSIYYSDCLQSPMESIEKCLEEGLELPSGYEIEFDLSGLLRMDTTTQIKNAAEGVKGGIYTPNEGRKLFGLGPVPGGDAVYLQEQNFSTEALGKRDALADPWASRNAKPAQAQLPAPPAANKENALPLVPLMLKGELADVEYA